MEDIHREIVIEQKPYGIVTQLCSGCPQGRRIKVAIAFQFIEQVY